MKGEGKKESKTFFFFLLWCRKPFESFMEGPPVFFFSFFFSRFSYAATVFSSFFCQMKQKGLVIDAGTPPTG